MHKYPHGKEKFGGAGEITGIDIYLLPAEHKCNLAHFILDRGLDEMTIRLYTFATLIKLNQYV